MRRVDIDEDGVCTQAQNGGCCIHCRIRAGGNPVARPDPQCRECHRKRIGAICNADAGAVTPAIRSKFFFKRLHFRAKDKPPALNNAMRSRQQGCMFYVSSALEVVEGNYHFKERRNLDGLKYRTINVMARPHMVVVLISFGASLLSS